jgi:hypothetical protein
MRFAIFREMSGGTRKFLLEWNQEQIEDALIEELKPVGELSGIGEYVLRRAFKNVIEKFKKESIKIP